MLTVLPYTDHAAVNDSQYTLHERERTVPIPSTITAVPGYPNKLVVYKMAASKFWQVRCWIAGRTHRRSCRTQSLRVAQTFARVFYEQLLALATTKHLRTQTDCTDVVSNKLAIKPKHTFAALAAQLVANEQSRVDRGEIALDSLQVLRNRLDAHILPRWGKMSPAEVDFSSLLTFTQFLSASFLTTTVSQYLIAVRKVLN